MGQVTCTIPASESLSSPVHFPGDTELRGIWVPKEWTAAAISFQVSRDGSEWAIVRDRAGGEQLYDANAAAGKLQPSYFPWELHAPFSGELAYRLVSGTSDLLVPQATDVTLVLLWSG
jgi:hypothetical protein